MIRIVLISLLFHLPCILNASNYSIFNDEKTLSTVRVGGSFIYNEEWEKADSVINLIASSIPEHPVVPMMRALNISWQEMPISMDSKNFKKHESYIKQCISLSEKIHMNSPECHDGIFFQIASRGLLAEYYSNAGSYIRAVSEAKKVYSLIKTAEELVDKNPEFLFSVGLYNYYREYYEENNPMMKPLLWFFRRGDKKLGLQQLEEATDKALLSKVEAHIYLSYIYLRYEKAPNKSIKLLERVNKEFPENNFVRAKLAECFVKKGEHQKAQKLYEGLILSKDSYYRMSGHALKALSMKKSINDNYQNIKFNYQKSVEASLDVPTSKGKYLRSHAHIELAKIYIKEDEKDEAQKLLETVSEISDDNKQRKELKKLLQELE